MTHLEDRLEELFGYGSESSVAPGALAAVDVLAVHGLLGRDRAAVWRARFERAGRPRPPVDPELRARCLALLERQTDDDEGGSPLDMLPYHFSEMGLITGADFHDDGDVQAHRHSAPLAVALGPPPAPGGVHVVWIAAYEDWVELGVRNVALDRVDIDRAVLTGADGTTYERLGHMIANLRGQISFRPRPHVATVELLIGDETIALPVPTRS